MSGKYVSVLLSAAMLTSMVSCGMKPPTSVMTDGASDFAFGKSEENYYLKGSDRLLDEMIRKFSGSLEELTDEEMTDEEREKLKKEHEQEQPTQPPTQPVTQPPTQPGTLPDGTPAPTEESTEAPTQAPTQVIVDTPEATSMDDIYRLFHDAYENNETYLNFVTDGTFTFDFSGELDHVYRTLQREDPIDICGVSGWRWWTSGDEYTVEIRYFYTESELVTIKRDTRKMLDKVVKECDLTGMSEYEKVDAVNEYLCDKTYYDERWPEIDDPYTHTAYNAFKNGCIVCEGYACAAKLILNYYGVECDIQTGECVGGGGHAWNLVKVNGDWYQLDICWNDGGGNRKEFFLKSDEYMKQSRSWIESDYPKCPSNYTA